MKIRAKGDYGVWIDDSLVSTHKDLSNAHTAAANLLLSGEADLVEISCSILLTKTGK